MNGLIKAIEEEVCYLLFKESLPIQRSLKRLSSFFKNLFWASIYNVLAVPVAGGVWYPNFGIMLRPEFAALLMSISSIIVAVNAVLLKRVEKVLIAV